MDIQSAKNEIKNTVKAYLQKDEFGDFVIDVIRQRPMYLLGAPGIGKTAIIEQIAEELEIGLVAYSITHHTRQSALGLPIISDRKFDDVHFKITEYSMSEIIASIYEQIEKKGRREGILFIDEINSASETLAPTMLQFLQSKIFGTHAVPKGWIIVGAGNPPEYNKSVKEFDIVTMDRIKKMEIEPDFEVWRKYAYQKRVHMAIINYLDLFKQNFYYAENSVDGMMIVTPRGWEDLSQMMIMYESLGVDFKHDLIMQYIQHPKVAKEFYQFYAIYLKYKEKIDVKSILNHDEDLENHKSLSKLRTDEKIAVIGLFVDALSSDFYTYHLEHSVIKGILDYLRRYKRDVKEIFNDNYNMTYLKKITDDIDHKLTHALDTNRKILQMMKKEINLFLETAFTASTADESFNIIKKQYDEKLNKFTVSSKLINKRVTRAINFVHSIFGDSNELFIFITELTISPNAVSFLKENRNEEYLAQSKKLLIGDQNKMILSEILKLEDSENSKEMN